MTRQRCQIYSRVVGLRSSRTADAMWSNLGVKGFIPYCIGNVLKYLGRAGLKDDTKQDISKALVYLLWAWASVAGHLDTIKPSEWLVRARESARGWPWEEVLK